MAQARKGMRPGARTRPLILLWFLGEKPKNIQNHLYIAFQGPGWD